MKRNQVVFFGIIFAAILVVVIGSLASSTESDDNGDSDVTVVNNNTDTGANTAPSGEPVQIVVQSSNTKQLWLTEMESQFNARNFTISNGRPIQVTVRHTGSPLELEDFGVSPDMFATAWSPSNQIWIDQQNQEWRDQTGQNLITEECPGTMSMPIGIAMWRPMAEALGWPDAEISWADIGELATNPNGWASLGLPEWGQFRFGHGHPQLSNSGRLSIVAQIYAASQNYAQLTLDDVYNQNTMEAVSEVQTSVFHYGRRDTFLLDRMVERGPSYLHAVTNYEGNIIRWNNEYAEQLRFPLVLVYPVDGTFWEDHPMCILDGADWVSEEQAEAARVFRDFILERDQQEQMVATGIRPAIDGIELTGANSPLTIENGVIPTISQEDTERLLYPSAEIMDNVIAMWEQVKKPATVILLMDTSLSMEGEPINAATRGAQAFISEMQPNDEIIVYTFNDEITRLGAGSVAEVSEELRTRVGALFADGGTALYLAVLEAYGEITEMREEDLARGENRTYSIVLLSDGEDQSSTVDSNGIVVNEARVLAEIQESEDASGVHIYAIAYGEEANENFLRIIANRTNGKFYEGSASDISDTYFEISLEF